jgi:uncharacterized protein YdcH (DUF465 family)
MASRQQKDDETSLHINPEAVINSIARIDEKINNTLKKQDELSARFEKLFDYYNKLLERVVGVESKNIGNITEIINGLLIKLGILEKTIDNLESDTNPASDLLVRVSLLEKEIQQLKNTDEGNTKVIKTLESETQKIMTSNEVSEQKWKKMLHAYWKFISIIWKFVEAILVAWLIFKFGFNK